MTEHNEALSPGERVAEGIWGRGYGELLRAIMNSFGPGFSDHIVSFFEHTYGREALDVKTRQICTLCGFSALGLAPAGGATAPTRSDVSGLLHTRFAPEGAPTADRIRP